METSRNGSELRKLIGYCRVLPTWSVPSLSKRLSLWQDTLEKGKEQGVGEELGVGEEWAEAEEEFASLRTAVMRSMETPASST
jgi:hypothetical protein